MTFRRVELADRPPVGVRAGVAAEERPALVYVPISRLVIDDSYQRPLTDSSWRAIRRIAEVFTWTRFTPCLVAPVGDGCYALIDGQHRTHAALMAGHDEVPAMVVPIDVRSQAQSFASVNGLATAVGPHHVFKAALTAGEDWAVRADRACAHAGARLMQGNASTRNRRAGEVFCVALIRDHIGAGRDEVVTRALGALLALRRGSTAPILWSNAMLRPWLQAVQSVPGCSAALLQAFLDDRDLERLDQGVFKMRQDPKYAGRPHGALLAEILTEMLKAWSRRVEPMT